MKTKIYGTIRTIGEVKTYPKTTFKNQALIIQDNNDDVFKVEFGENQFKDIKDLLLGNDVKILANLTSRSHQKEDGSVEYYLSLKGYSVTKID